MFFKIYPINIGIFVIIFVISFALLIFAPRSKNYYNSNIFPIIQYLNDNNKDVFFNDLEIIKKDKEWLIWPTSVNNDVFVYPIFMFGIFSEYRKVKCNKSLKLINNIPNIKTFAYLKISKKSCIIKNKKWKDISNNTFCCLFILEAPYVSKKDECCIWVDGETKKIVKNDLIVYDASKENSIINKSDYPIYILMLDVKKPLKYTLGISDVEYDNKVHDFLNKIKKENE